MRRHAIPVTVVVAMLVLAGCLVDSTYPVGAGNGRAAPGLWRTPGATAAIGPDCQGSPGRSTTSSPTTSRLGDPSTSRSRLPTFVRVGYELVPGVYSASGSSGCYWQLVSGWHGTFSEILANHFGPGGQIVRISPTDAGFSSSDRGNWVYVGPQHGIGRRESPPPRLVAGSGRDAVADVHGAVAEPIHVQQFELGAGSAGQRWFASADEDGTDE